MTRTEERPRRFGAPGGARLEGRIAVPEGAVAGVVVAHPHPLHGGDMENPVVKALVEAVARRGVASLRFDFRHARTRVPVTDAQLLGDAEGDLVAAVECLRAALPAGAPVAIAGYSFGGVAALRVAPRVGAAAVAVVGLPVRMAARALDAEALGAAGIPLLVLQGQYDEVGKPGEVRALAENLGAPLEVREVPDASHGYFGEAGLGARTATGFLVKRLRG